MINKTNTDYLSIPPAFRPLADENTVWLFSDGYLGFFYLYYIKSPRYFGDINNHFLDQMKTVYVKESNINVPVNIVTNPQPPHLLEIIDFSNEGFGSGYFNVSKQTYIDIAQYIMPLKAIKCKEIKLEVEEVKPIKVGNILDYLKADVI
jgi:hypothetical protein